MSPKRFAKYLCKKTTLNSNVTPKTTPRSGNKSKNRLLCILRSYMYFKITLKRF